MKKQKSRYCNTNLPRNVNLYSHFFANHTITEQDINWVLRLRSEIRCSVESHYDDQENNRKEKGPFSFSNKLTKSFQRKVIKFDEQNRSLSNFSHIDHLLEKSFKNPLPTDYMIRFQSTLRQTNWGNMTKQKERRWQRYTNKSSKIIPKILRSNQSLVQAQAQQKQAIIDSILGYPTYTEKIVERSNWGEFPHLLTNQKSLPTLAFQSSLRKKKIKN